MVRKKKQVRRIANRPDHNSMWGYKDTPFQNYDEVEVMPSFSLYDVKGSSVQLDEVKKVLKVGRSYNVKPSMLNKSQKAKLVGVYSDPIGFGNRGKNTDVRLKTEWVFQDAVGSYPKGRHEIIEDMNLDYATRNKKRQKVEDRLWKKHGMNKPKALTELKKLIREGKY